MFADFSSIPDTDTGWYKLVANISLSQDSSPYLVVGAPYVTVKWANVPLDFACQHRHSYTKNTLALFNTQVGGVRGVISGWGLRLSMGVV